MRNKAGKVYLTAAAMSISEFDIPCGELIRYGRYDAVEPTARPLARPDLDQDPVVRPRRNVDKPHLIEIFRNQVNLLGLFA